MKDNLTGDYYSQLALLNTLKLQGVDVADFNALQSILSMDKQYEYFFKENCSVSVKIGLTLKLKTELEYQLKISEHRAKDDIQELKEMVKNLSKTATVALDTESLKEIKKLKEDLVPMNKALKYKAENVVKKNTKEEIRKQIRARKLLKSGS